MFKSPINMQEIIHMGAASVITIFSILVVLNDRKYGILFPVIFIGTSVLCFNYGRLSKIKKYGILSKYSFFFMLGLLFVMLTAITLLR